MAKKFSNVFEVSGAQAIPQEFPVDAGAAATIKNGMCVSFTSGGRYVVESSDGDDSSKDICGIAAYTSDETASVDGVVNVFRAPVLRATGKATTPANLANTTNLDLVTLDVSGTDHTVDEDGTSAGFIRMLSFDDTTNGNVEVEFPCRYVLWT